MSMAKLRPKTTSWKITFPSGTVVQTGPRSVKFTKGTVAPADFTKKLKALAQRGIFRDDIEKNTDGRTED